MNLNIIPGAVLQGKNNSHLKEVKMVILDVNELGEYTFIEVFTFSTRTPVFGPMIMNMSGDRWENK